MKRFNFADWLSFWNRIGISCLVFTWCLGLSCGFQLVSFSEPKLSSLMDVLIIRRGSIIGLMMINILPLVISAVIIRFRIPYLLVPIVFFKALLRGFSLSCFLHAYCNSGWLLAFLLMFSQSGSTVFLLWFWVKHIHYTGVWHGRGFLIAGFADFVFVIFEYLIIQPFLIELMIYS